MRVEVIVNGAREAGEIHPGETLMELLRRWGHTGVKNGCAHGDCGTCAVLLDGRAVTSCLLFAAQAEGREVTTVEALDAQEGLHPLQAALLDAGGVQCGFCTPGILMVAVDLLSRHPRPDQEQWREALAGNLCRCTGYVKILEGLMVGAERMAAGEEG